MHLKAKILSKFSEREAVKETRQAQEGDRHAAHWNEKAAI